LKTVSNDPAFELILFPVDFIEMTGGRRMLPAIRNVARDENRNIKSAIAVINDISSRKYTEDNSEKKHLLDRKSAACFEYIIFQHI